MYLYRPLSPEDLKRLPPRQLEMHTNWLLEHAGQSPEKPFLTYKRNQRIFEKEMSLEGIEDLAS